MKSLAVLACALAAGNAVATLDIPDGNPLGVSSTINVSGLGTISTLSLTLNISGGNNGDLYAYLSYDGTLVTLLDRPGTALLDNPVGFTDAGYSVTVEDGYSSLNDATGGSPVTGIYSATSGTFSEFTGDSTGPWTLFIADMSGGDGSDSQLDSWFLDINGITVPEPVTGALLVFGAGALSIIVGRRLCQKRTA